ncbi:unnamed protein product [Callosobruchus maculatus]|uniref:Uncharacterized protein n=1 Tax=Callosobruchus maculatus TaxID=64391 RepID=A0A653C421_CALMS|nr:unnamed protein product [Callosobruchus maculatus]
MLETAVPKSCAIRGPCKLHIAGDLCQDLLTKTTIRERVRKSALRLVLSDLFCYIYFRTEVRHLS